MTAIFANGLKELESFFERQPEIARKAATFAINDVATGTGMTVLRNSIYEQINYPRGYLTKDRLGVTSRATSNKLEAVIKGRDRATSLARFVVGGRQKPTAQSRGVTVRVKPNATRDLPAAWLVNLRNGNQGLAIRLKPGEKLAGKTSPNRVMLAPDVYLLYGPSVEQVFKGVAADNGDKIADLVASQFLRQMARLNRG